MRALQLHQFGSPAVLKVEEVPTPVPTEDEVLVRVAAASVNPSDVKNVGGMMKRTTLPRTPGRDFAGTVTAGQEELIGTEVWGTGGGDLGFTRDGTHAEYVLVPATGVAQRPQQLPAEAAACCGVTFVTAAYGLREAGLASGLTVVVIGVLGGVGRAAAQIAIHTGAKVIGIARQDPPGDLPPSLRSVRLVNSTKENLAEAVRALTGGRGADIVYDTVGGSMFLEGLKLLVHGGRIIEITVGRDPNVTLNMRDFYHQEARLIGIDSVALDATQCAGILQGLGEGFAHGELTPPPIAARYPLEQAASAYEAVERGGEGRHVLTPGLRTSQSD